MLLLSISLNQGEKLVFQLCEQFPHKSFQLIHMLTDISLYWQREISDDDSWQRIE